MLYYIMDIENEWENFLDGGAGRMGSGGMDCGRIDTLPDLSNDAPGSEQYDITDLNINSTSNSNTNPTPVGREVPKCSPIYISTKTNIAYFNVAIDLKKTFWEILVMDYGDDREGIVKKQMKFNSSSKEEQDTIEEMYDKETKFKSFDVINHIDTTSSKTDTFKDVRKITVGISKKDILSYRTKKKSAFYNCFVTILRLWDETGEKFREVHMKIFNTGKVEVPGIQDDEMFFRSIDYMKDMLIGDYCDIDYSRDKIDTVLINSNFSCGYLINRENLFDVLVNKYKIQSLYDPCSYPGVQSKYSITEDGGSGGSGRVVELSFMIFRTGSVLIVGKCENRHIMIVYEFLKGLFAREYETIHQHDHLGIGMKEKVVKPQKQRKRTIVRAEAV
jgi:hypothetical protein